MNSHFASGGSFETYLNPVYPKSFPDPFVLKHDGNFYGYSTGSAEDGNVFEVITSTDLVNWTVIGGAMTPLQPSPPFYWAPEVTYSNGRFYLYYSSGNETLMEIRVAVSDKPDAGFLDSGHRLTYEDFAIDAHVFIDDDGSKYLFYATDFLEYTQIGTGTVVDRMIDWFTLAGEPHPVTRAKYDWQIYDPNRKEKGGVRWHTVEGPTVLKRKGIYYEMFSGGNWQNTTYGVSFATADTIDVRDEWEQFSDGEKVLPILRTEPGVIVGPGHNSVVRGPNNRELYCVYHRWTDAGRVLAIDRMDFTGRRIFVVGATHTPQPIPFAPSKQDSTITDLRLDDLTPSFLCEMTFRCNAPVADSTSASIDFSTSDGGFSLELDPTANEARLAGGVHQFHRDFDWNAKHLIRLEVDLRRLRIAVDDEELPAPETEPVKSISLSPNNLGLEISSFELTEGFEELFEDDRSLESNGWQTIGGANWRIESGELLIHTANMFELIKHRPLPRCEIAAYFRIDTAVDSGGFGIALRGEKKDVLRLSLEPSTLSASINGESKHRLSDGIALDEYHQLRIVKTGTEAYCYFDDVLIEKIEVEDLATSAFVFADRMSCAVEMIRLTAL
ncbi:MAG: hypothetical protein DMF63_09505 [Acidobacteria bacterium]|nr:MAG: hypothetical protein DMF63_09505 [Acidobacteriota bacterium]